MFATTLSNPGGSNPTAIVVVLTGWKEEWTSSSARKKLDKCDEGHIAARVVDRSFGLNHATFPPLKDREL